MGYILRATGMDTPPSRDDDGVARPYRPNFVLAALYERFFSRIEVDPAWVRAVREASARGTVVHVMRSQSYLDFVALDFFIKKFSLPPLRFVTDTGLWVLEPMGQGIQKLLRRDSAPEEVRLSRAVSENHAALLFMRRPPELAVTARRGRAQPVDHIRVLLEVQRRHDQPVLLLPQVFLWGKSPDTHQKNLVDLVFGPTDYPGRLRVMSRFLRNYRHALLRAGAPLDLRAILAETPDLDDGARVSKIHWMLFRRLDRERRVVLGPIAKGPDRLGLEILQTPRVRRAAADAAAREKRPIELVVADLYRELRRLEARPDPDAIALADVALAGVFRQMFDGVEVDAEGFARVREAARRGPVVLLPTHKSHVDYLLLSWVCFRQGLQTPLIAAGDNLDFWPLGPVLRRCGAFFIRRSLAGENTRLYATLLDAYVRKMMREGYVIEFFFEGGRSRSGRLLPPKHGLLSLVLDAAATGGERVSLVPISVGYDRVVEERSYVEELSGTAKKREDASALLRAPRALLSRYGRVYVEVGDIVEWSAEPPPDNTPGNTPGNVPGKVQGADTSAGRRAERDRMVSRRAQVTRVAQRVSAELHRVTPVTPTSLLAAALLSHPHRGVTRRELQDALNRLLGMLTGAGARVGADLRRMDDRPGVDEHAVDRAIALVRRAGHLQILGEGLDAAFVVPDEHRPALDYYKNNILHFIAPRALMAVAVLCPAVRPAEARGRAEGGPREAVLARAERLGQVFRHEFEHRSPRDESPAATLAAMLADGDLTEDHGAIRPPVDEGHAWLTLLAGTVRNYLEGYRVGARTLEALLSQSLPAAELVRRGLATGRRMFLAGEIQRREAVSRAMLEGAFAAFRDLEYLGGGEGGPQRLKAPWDTPEAVRTLEDELAGFCP